MIYYDRDYLLTLADMFGMTALANRLWLERTLPTLAKYFPKDEKGNCAGVHATKTASGQ